MKKLLSLLTVISLLLVMMAPVYAIEEISADPDVVDVCNGNPYHEMVP